MINQRQSTAHANITTTHNYAGNAYDNGGLEHFSVSGTPARSASPSPMKFSLGRNNILGMGLPV